MPTITLQPITRDTLNAILALKTSEDQRRFVATVERSMAQASLHPNAYPRGIYAGDEPVGFVMLDIDDAAGQIWIWRLMVDHRFQGRGYGRAAVGEVISLARGWGAAEVRLTYVPATGHPAPFYASIGFTETGEIEDGERIMVLDLGGDAPPAPRLAHASRYDAVALHLERAAGHARVAARHLRADAIPHTTAHAWGARGEILLASDDLDALAKIHAGRSDPG